MIRPFFHTVLAVALSIGLSVSHAESSPGVWDYLTGVFGGEQKAATSAVEMNGSIYAQALKEAAEKNSELTAMTKERKERAENLEKSIKAIETLREQSKNHEQKVIEFKRDLAQGYQDYIAAAEKLKSMEKESKANREANQKAHKDLGTLTSEDGESRIGSHAYLNIEDTLGRTSDGVKKFAKETEAKLILNKTEKLEKLLKEETERAEKSTQDIIKTTEELRKLQAYDEEKAFNDEKALSRKVTLGALMNAVNNLVIQANTAQNLEKMAFHHFQEVGKELSERGVTAKDVKDEYRKNGEALASQFNETPMGVYVNGQISKAMGSVCDLVANQCRDGSTEEIFNFLNDTKRGSYTKSPSSKEAEAKADKAK